ncbi:hypothetical protein BKA70DRAFT_1445606 [Coprinopsis sp. MPI-PUGE-AT-0042]|nr:hypothetical protein BKA70DRAFT_1445606 [Coprinopsis sp. MPI-PUGE-AT-0042]
MFNSSFGNERDTRRRSQDSDPDFLDSLNPSELRIVNSPAPHGMYHTGAMQGEGFSAPGDHPPCYSQSSHYHGHSSAQERYARTGARRQGDIATDRWDDFSHSFSNNLRSQSGGPQIAPGNANYHHTAPWVPNWFAGGSQSGTGSSGRAAIPLRSSYSAPPLDQAPIVHGIMREGLGRDSTPSPSSVVSPGTGQSKSGGGLKGITGLFRRSPANSSSSNTPASTSTTSGGPPTQAPISSKGKARHVPSPRPLPDPRFARHSTLKSFEILPYMAHFPMITRNPATSHPPSCLVSFLGRCQTPASAEDGCRELFHLRAHIDRKLEPHYILNRPRPTSEQRRLIRATIRADELKSINLVTYEQEVDPDSGWHRNAEGIPHNSDGQCLISMMGLCVDPDCPDLRWYGFIAWYNPSHEIASAHTRRQQAAQAS